MNLWPVIPFFLSFACLACVEIQTFPDNGAPAIDQPEEFTALAAHQERFKGQSVRIAGRIAGVEPQQGGLLIIAEWLLFPKNPNLRPETPHPGDQRGVDNKKPRFLVLYAGTIESDFTWQGNEFLAIGEPKGTQELVNIVGTVDVVPYIEARCVHVWQTGSADLSQYTLSDPLTFRYPPPLERTYCLKPSQKIPVLPTNQSRN